MKKLLLLFAILLIVTVTITACSNKDAKESSVKKTAENGLEVVESTKSSGKNASSVSETFPLTVTDAGKYKMTIPEKPKKIVSLTLGTDEMLLSLVDTSRILSLTRFADDPGISNVVKKAKAVKLRTESNAEKVISLKPDLVFVDTWANAEFVKQVRDAGINVYQFKTPSSIEEQRDVILEIATVVGEKEKGHELVAWMDKKLKAVQDKLKALKPEQRLSILSYDELGCTAGEGTNFDSIAKKAGLINAASKAGMKLWEPLSKEKMVELNPDILLLPSWFYDKSKTVESFTESIRKDPALSTLKAVKNNRLLVLPNPHMSAISHYVVLGVEDLAKAAYPELFE